MVLPWSKRGRSPEGLVSVTVKHVPAGKMSPYFTRQAEPGSIVFLGEVEGTFSLPDPLPAKTLFISAGSGITPIMSMLRELDRRAAVDDVVHLHCARTAEDFIFMSMMRDLAATHKLPLDEAPRAYEMFQKKEDGAAKILLQP